MGFTEGNQDYWCIALCSILQHEGDREVDLVGSGWPSLCLRGWPPRSRLGKRRSSQSHSLRSWIRRPSFRAGLLAYTSTTYPVTEEPELTTLEIYVKQIEGPGDYNTWATRVPPALGHFMDRSSAVTTEAVILNYLVSTIPAVPIRLLNHARALPFRFLL